MKSIKLLAIVIVTGILLSSASPTEEWTSLIDKDLSQWRTYLSYRHKIGYNGSVPKDDSGADLLPIGYDKDVTHVFSVVDDKGEPMLRVSGEIYGAIFTKQEFENYHFTLKIKWGERKYDPRKEKLKDSGILYHSIGDAGVEYWRSWMLSQEFQIMEGHIGDFWSQASSAIDIRAYQSEGKMNCVADPKQPFLPFGRGNPEGYCMRSENYESPPGEWTTLELISYQGQSLHIVNGHVVMVLRNSRYLKDGAYAPLIKGKIQLQSESAELYFKDIRIRPLTSMPKEYAGLF